MAKLKASIFVVCASTALVYASSSAALFGPSSYAECIFDNINPTIPSRGIMQIETNCRELFPQPSTSFFEPDLPNVCYEKHKDLANSKPAAKAIYKACADYNYRPSQLRPAP